MKDLEYFDDKIFVFSNENLKRLLKEYSGKTQLPLYVVIDNALRDFLKNKGYEINKSPKIPKLVKE